MFKSWLDNPSDQTKRTLITRMLRKSPPRRYALSDNPREVDFLTLVIRDRKGMTDMLVKRLFETWVEGLQYSKSTHSYERPISIKLGSITSDLVVIRHAYGPLTATYTGWGDYRHGAATGHVRWTYLKHRVRSALGARLVRFSKDRFELLQGIVNLDLRDAEIDSGSIFHKGFNRFSLYERLYGEHAYSHPRYKQQLRRFDLLLDSLVAEGALETKDLDGVSVGPKAMQVLSDYELANRRHRDAVRQNWILIFLTFALVFATALGPWLSRIVTQLWST